MTVLTLMGLGVVMVYSASIHIATLKEGDGGHYLVRQGASAIVALVALGFGIAFPYRNLRRVVYPVLLLSLAALALLLVPGLGVTAGNATRWFRLPFFSVQPSELAKLAFVIWLAWSIEKKDTEIKSFTIGLLPHLLVCGALILLCLAQPDLGVCIVLASVMVLMLFVAGTRVSYLLGMFFVAVPVLTQTIATNSMRMQRILAFLDPWEHRYAGGYALVNSMTAMGSGGLWGRGLGGSLQKYGYIPEAQTDFIFPIIGEELGFVGATAVILLFAFLVFRGVRIALAAPDGFGRHLAFGLTALIGVQATINIGVSMALLPTKGLTLPFISYGGSSLVVSAFAVGVLLNISRRRQAEVEASTPASSSDLVWDDAPHARGGQA
jgi:cell division protein FtsW